MGATEVYKHAPLAMVVAEILFTHEPSLADAKARDRALASIRDELPILVNKQIMQGALFVPGRETPTEFSTKELLEAMSVDGQTLVTLATDTVSVSMSGAVYGHYGDTLRPLIDRVLDCVSDTLRQVAVRRIGLRYLDELRVPNPPANAAGWSEWVNPSLVAATTAPVGGHITGTKASFESEVGGGVRVQFNAGSFDGTTIIADDHPFSDRSKAKGPGPMFILDLDASWQPEFGFELFNSEAIKKTFDTLHEPTSGLFEWAIGDLARELFRGKA